MSNLLFTGVLAVTAALAAHPAVFAGEHQVRRVALTEDANWWNASGNLADVHNSQSTVEAISCWIRGTPNYNDGFCFARDEKGKTLQCATMDEAMLKAIAAISGDSTVSFSIRKDEGRCGGVIVTNGSYAAPKNHATPTSAPAFDVTGTSVVQ